MEEDNIGPSSKKRKVDDRNDEKTTQPTLTMAPCPNSNFKEQTEASMDALLETLEALESSDNPSEAQDLFRSSSLSLLQMKSLQRGLLDSIRDLQTQVQTKRQQQKEEQMQLENLRYQKESLHHAIKSCQGTQIKQLETFCRNQIEQDETTTSTKKSPSSPSSTSKTIDEIMAQVLEGNIYDPNQHQKIVSKLHQDIEIRTNLEQELKTCQEKVSKIKESLVTKRKLVADLPNKINDMERASLPLQRFFHQQINPSLLMIGTKRRQRLDMAQSLPRPLYTLFYQLQTYLDTLNSPKNNNDNGNGNGNNDDNDDGNDDNNNSNNDDDDQNNTQLIPTLKVKETAIVELLVPIPSISSESSTSTSTSSRSSKRFVTFKFEYDKDLDIIIVHATSDHDLKGLIDELFPGDTGDWFDDTDMTNDNQSSSSIKTKGAKPYHWCNYLAGLHVPYPEPTKQRQSTRVVVQSLIRRVKARVTLSWLFHSLSKKPHPIPVHASVKNSLETPSNIRIVAWDEQEMKDQPHHRAFILTLQLQNDDDTNNKETNNSNSSVQVKVLVNPARYPAEPPTWQFVSCNAQHSWGQNQGTINDLQQTNPLYDERLAMLEQQVNTDLESLVSSNESSCDWILTHQLVQIAKSWEEMIMVQSG